MVPMVDKNQGLQAPSPIFKELLGDGMVDSFAEFHPKARERFTCPMPQGPGQWGTSYFDMLHWQVDY